MTLYKPAMKVNRLAVYRNDRIAFEASFHSGVNILRGQNSSGKTTILDFIAFTLGAEFIPWKAEALLCTDSFVEVELNGNPATFRRMVNSNTMNPLQIYWGRLIDALKAGVHEWEAYPFRRSANKVSFSQAIFLALEMPEARGDGASNLTMHQFLRIMYADQPSLHSPIFRVDSFDNVLTRETVGGYLCGVYNDELYSAQLRKRDVEKSLERLVSELRSIFSVLGKSGQGAEVDWVVQRLQNAAATRDAVEVELARLKNERTLSANEPKDGNVVAELRVALSAAKKLLKETTDRQASVELEIADSQRFITELEARLQNLNESKATRSYLGALTFSFCPSCLSELPHAEGKGECGLCKNNIEDKAGDAQLLRMQNELSLQRRESLALMELREEELRQLRIDVPIFKERLKALEKKYGLAGIAWSSPIEEAIEAAARKLGEVEQEIKNLSELQRLAAAIAELQEMRDRLNNELSNINSTIEKLHFAQESRKALVAFEISTTLARLLRLDLPRTKEFQEAENVQFSFVDNFISVNGATHFSESSTVVLRHLFHLALLSVATRLDFIRLPRFLILDGIEDGGMELERSHRLQKIIVDECATFKSEYQLIFATSQIDPALEIDDLVAGRSFTKDSKSLAFV